MELALREGGTLNTTGTPPLGMMVDLRGGSDPPLGMMVHVRGGVDDPSPRDDGGGYISVIHNFELINLDKCRFCFGSSQSL